MKKFLMVFLIVVASLAVLLYGGVYLGHKVFFKEAAPPAPAAKAASSVPTIEAATDGKLMLGMQAHKTQPKTLEEYLPIAAAQLKKYNEVAPSLWPDNPLVNQTFILEGLESKKLWLITPDGTVSPLSDEDAKKYNFKRDAYPGGFSFFEGGFYCVVSEKEVADYSIWQKYLHLGTYDAIIFLIHEGFHETQRAWAETDDISNGDRNEFLENTEARAKRALLEKQLLKAVNKPGDTALILDALATYQDWKTQFPDDYKNSLYADRWEGTAYYYELIASLYAGYPDQIKNKDDLTRALALLASRDDVYVDYGLVKEGYAVGGFACMLLDRLEEGWEKRLMNDPTATPIEMLSQHFKDKALPTPAQPTQAERDAIIEANRASQERMQGSSMESSPEGKQEGKQEDSSESSPKSSQLSKVFKLLYDLLY